MSILHKPAVAIGVSFAVGAAAGLLTNPTSRSTSEKGEAQESTPQSETSHSRTGSFGADQKSDGALGVSNTSELAKFSGFDFEKQKGILLGLSTKFGKGIPPGMQIWIGRITKELSGEQAIALLEALPAGKDANTIIRDALAARLAATDPNRAMEMGKNLSDPQLVGSAISALAQKSGSAAIKAIDSLSPEQQGKLLRGSFSDGTVKVGGSFEDLAKALKESPAFQTKGQPPGGWAINQMLANSLASGALTDPATALSQMRDLAAEVDKNNAARDEKDKKTNNNGRTGAAFVQGLMQSTLAEMRATNPAAASAFYDSLTDRERAPWLASDEAVSRFQRGGIDAAVSFSEKQTNDEATRTAALGTWWSLAQQDRSAAMGWIDSVPQGPFRQGVLSGVMMDAWNQSKTWGNPDTAVQAGTTLASKAAQLDYFTALMSDRHLEGKHGANSELISKLPISDADKQELYRRVAPIKPQ